MKYSKKLLNIFFTGTLIIACAQFTSKINATIPEYKGLYTLFTNENDTTPAVDTIGIGQALFYSGWIENMYTYGVEFKETANQNVQTIKTATPTNPASTLISMLWFKRLISGHDTEQQLTDADNFYLS